MKKKIPHIVKKFKIPIRKSISYIYRGGSKGGAPGAAPPPKIGEKIRFFGVKS
jgi:hypothetical protein